jgi:hypothetical protein
LEQDYQYLQLVVVGEAHSLVVTQDRYLEDPAVAQPQKLLHQAQQARQDRDMQVVQVQLVRDMVAVVVALVE